MIQDKIEFGIKPGSLNGDYHAQHADLFRTVADILVRDYIAPNETANMVAEWCHQWPDDNSVEVMEPSELAALIADVEGYERR